MRKALIIPDCHIPFECLDSYRIMLDVAQAVYGKPNTKKPGLEEIVILGDFLDIYGLSRFDADPTLGDLSELYDREIECGNVRLDELERRFPLAKKIYLEGNHELRMRRFLKTMAPALRNRLTIFKELQIDKRPRFKWIPFDKLQSYQVLGLEVYARHCPVAGGTCANNAKQAGESILYGHTHQIGMGTFVNKITGKLIHAYNLGCLIDMKSKVFDYVPTRPNWAHGFGFVSGDYGHYQVDIVEIKNKKAIFNGKVYK